MSRVSRLKKYKVRRHKIKHINIVIKKPSSKSHHNNHINNNLLDNNKTQQKQQRRICLIIQKNQSKQTSLMSSSKYNNRRYELVAFAFLLVLKLHAQVTPISAFSSVVIVGRTKQSVKTTTSAPLSIMSLTTTNCNDIDSNALVVMEEEEDNGSQSSSLSSRRSMLMQMLATTTGAMTMTMVSSSSACYAASTKRNINPETAYINLRKAREELAVAGRNYFPKRDWEGLRDYLDNEDSCINNFEANTGALLTSNRLDAESKKAIGTIRRFGVAADVIIMYGGLKAEISEDNERPNSAEIEKYYIKTLDSLEEVIAIVRSNPGFSKIN